MNGEMYPPASRPSSSPSDSPAAWASLRRVRLVWRTLRWGLAATLVPLALWACNAHPLEQPKPAPEQQTDLRYEVNPVRKLDLIFMIDNSSSMRNKQENLRKNFPAFMQKLVGIQGGIPDMHIAVISSNVGAGPTTPDRACPPGGDRGRFQVLPNCGLDPTKSGYFLTVDTMGKTNFEDQGGLAKLPDLFQCMAFLGDTGCGFEHQLLSLYFALDGKTNPENAGFIREDAYLGVVMLSDEDDCSGSPDADFFSNPVIPGQSGSVRCSLLGHTCNGQPVPAMPFMAPLSSCMPYERNDATEEKSRLVNVSFFIDFLKGLKGGRTDKILVSEVIGWSDDPNAQYSIVNQPAQGGGTQVDTGQICTGEGGGAPGLRLHQFATAFDNHTIFPICQSDLSPAMDEIGKRLVNLLENTCITSPLLDTNDNKADGVQPDCQVDDDVPLNDGSGRYRAQSLPPCSLNKGMPCWDLVADMTCPGSGFRTEVKRDTPAAPGTLQSINCLTCPTGSTDTRCVH